MDDPRSAQKGIITVVDLDCIFDPSFIESLRQEGFEVQVLDGHNLPVAERLRTMVIVGVLTEQFLRSIPWNPNLKLTARRLGDSQPETAAPQTFWGSSRHGIPNIRERQPNDHPGSPVVGGDPPDLPHSYQKPPRDCP